MNNRTALSCLATLGPENSWMSGTLFFVRSQYGLHSMCMWGPRPIEGYMLCLRHDIGAIK